MAILLCSSYLVKTRSSVQLWHSGMSHIKCRKLSNVSTKIAVAIFGPNVYDGHFFWKQAAGGKWNVMNLIVRAEEQAGRR